jgi:excisionase family DNA binding protein
MPLREILDGENKTMDTVRDVPEKLLVYGDTSFARLHALKNDLVFDIEKSKTRGLWDVEDVADYLGVEESTVRDWVYKRKIPYRKAGRNVRFSPLEIEKWTIPTQK